MKKAYENIFKIKPGERRNTRFYMIFAFSCTIIELFLKNHKRIIKFGFDWNSWALVLKYDREIENNIKSKVYSVEQTHRRPNRQRNRHWISSICIKCKYSY